MMYVEGEEVNDFHCSRLWAGTGNLPIHPYLRSFWMSIVGRFNGNKWRGLALYRKGLTEMVAHCVFCIRMPTIQKDIICFMHMCTLWL